MHPARFVLLIAPVYLHTNTDAYLHTGTIWVLWRRMEQWASEALSVVVTKAEEEEVRGVALQKHC